MESRKTPDHIWGNLSNSGSASRHDCEVDMIVCNCLLNKDETTYNFFPMYMFACLQHATVFFNFTSERVSPITIANISDCNIYPSATARLFAIRNGGSFSMSTGYVNLQFRPSTKVSLISSKFAEADSIGLFSLLYVTARWSPKSHTL